MSRRPAGLLLGLAALLCCAAPASAGTYTVSSCRGPQGQPLSAAAWQSDPADAGTSDTCAAGGALDARLTGRGATPPALSGYRFALPAGVVIAGYRISLTASTAAAAAPGDVQAGLGAGSLLGLPPVVGGCLVAGCTFGAAPDPLSPATLLTDGGLPVPSGLALVARCTPGPACRAEEDQDAVATVRLWRSAVDLRDDAAPLIGPGTGSLLGPGAVSGRASIAAAASDVGGGVASVTLLIDGATHEVRVPGGACTEPYVVAAPCPGSLPATFEVDTAPLTPGDHTAELVARDAAGAERSTGPQAFSVARPQAPAGPLQIERVVVPLAPVAADVRVDRRVVRLPARGAAITGSVVRADGTPAAGVQLAVRSRRFGAGAALVRTEGTVRADAAGRFTVPAGTTPRRVVIALDDAAYRPAESGEVAVYGPLRLGLRLVGRNLRNGSTMALVAAIDGAGPGAPEGRTVLVQAIVGGRWATVDSVEAARHGTATWRYRFRGTTRPAIYRFRVRVAREAGPWPWPSATSRVVEARVRP